MATSRTTHTPVNLRNEGSLSRQVVCACGHVGWYGGSLTAMQGQRCASCEGTFSFRNGVLHVAQLVAVAPEPEPVSLPPIGDEALEAYVDEPIMPEPTGTVLILKRRRVDPEDVA